MKLIRPCALLCAFTLLLCSTASYAADDLPAWISGSLIGKGITASAEGETEEEALINALGQLSQNIQTNITASKKAYSDYITAPEDRAASKMLSSYQFGPELSIDSMDKLNESSGHFSSTLKVMFRKNQKTRIYSYFTEADKDMNNTSKSISVQAGNGLSFYQLKAYLKENGVSILSHHGLVKNEPLFFVWLDYTKDLTLKN
jgi:hypothetical protein